MDTGSLFGANSNSFAAAESKGLGIFPSIARVRMLGRFSITLIESLPSYEEMFTHISFIVKSSFQRLKTAAASAAAVCLV